MAPIKFEENIREKLQERELQPSSDAWNVLSDKLDQAPQKKRPSFLWMAVAASLVGVLLVVGFLFNKESDVSNELVNEETVEQQEESIVPFQKDEVVDQAIAKELEVQENETLVEEATQELNKKVIPVKMDTQIATESPKKPSESREETPFIKNKDQLITSIKEEEAVAKVKKNEEVIIDAPLGSETVFIQQKIEQVVAEVKELQKENNTITEADINALLAKAQSDIATNRILHSGTAKVDATALLQDVETELEQNFRNKVFEALGDGFNKVRTAVVERNN